MGISFVVRHSAFVIFLPMNLSVPIISVLIGGAILLFGRKLFWLFVAALGFAVGLEIAAYFMREPPQWMTLLVALGCGVIGALLAILLQKLAIALAGFIAGGRIAWALASAFYVDHMHYRGITFVIGGILGALLLLALFNWVLILLSSVEGAHLIASGITLPEKGSLILFIALAVIGLLVQGSMLRRSRSASV
jgi:hypothetical protein